MHHDHPDLVKDQYWDDVFPDELPYSVGSEAFRDTHPLPSTANIAVRNTENADLLNPSSLKIDDMQSYMDSGPIMFSAKPMKSKGSQNSIMGSSVPGWIFYQKLSF